MKVDLFDIKDGFRALINNKILELERTKNALLKAGILPEEKRRKFDEAIKCLKEIRDGI